MSARKRLAWLVLLAWGAGAPLSMHAYQQYGFDVNGRTVLVRWNRMPVQYYVANVGASGISASQLQAAVDRAFTTWHNVSTASVSAQFAGYTNAKPFEDDGRVVIGFLNEPDEEDTLGATNYTIDSVTGEIIESDIFFNSTFPWSVSASGDSDAFDLESIALHEIGHLWGLGHSAIGETELRSGGRRVIASGAALFPIAFSPGNTKGRALQADDIAGISDLYPAGDFRTETGSVNGQVQKNGKAVFGAHVVAFNPADGALIGGLTDESGNFSIAGLKPGPVILRVEPLDDADLDGFFDDTSKVDLDFRVTFYNRYAVAPRGGSSNRIQIQVAPK